MKTQIITTQPRPLSFMLMAIFSAIFMGTIGLFARFTALPAQQVTFYRLAIGALGVLCYMLLTGKRQQIRHRPNKRTLINGLMLAGFMLAYVQAIEYTTMANAVMLIYFAPLFSAVIAHFAFGEKLALPSIGAIGLALLGFAMMMEFSWGSNHNPDEWIGLLYCLLAMLTYSGFMLINRKPAQSSPYQSALVQLSVGALSVLPLVIYQPILPTLDQAGWLLLIGIVPGFMAILCAVKALRHLPAVTYGTLAYVEPVAVVIFAWWFFAETLSPLQLAGCGLIIIAGIGQGLYAQPVSATKSAA